MNPQTSFIPKPSLPPPTGSAGPFGWIHRNLFYSPGSALLTLATLSLLAWGAWFVFDWGFTKAVWDASSRRECLDRSPEGACWAGVFEWIGALIYGRYPQTERWRVDLAFAVVAFWMAPLWLPRVCSKPVIALSAVLFGPVLIGYLLSGGPRGWTMQMGFALALSALAFSWLHVVLGWTTPRGLGQRWFRRAGRNENSINVSVVLLVLLLATVIIPLISAWSLPPVKTNLWGGLFLTFVIAGVGVVASLPLGVLLALGRRSSLLFIRALVIAYIELLRSVPLITVLFMAVTMMPLFLPVDKNPDKLLLVLFAVVFFSSAYMAEVIRGGIQAVGSGQVEAALSIGLGRWQVMRLIVLPQALQHMIPNIASNFIGLLKDTTVVAIVGLYDFTRMLQVPSQTPTWIGLHIELFVIGGTVYLLLCMSISRYSRRLERKLADKQ